MMNRNPRKYPRISVWNAPECNIAPFVQFDTSLIQKTWAKPDDLPICEWRWRASSSCFHSDCDGFCWWWCACLFVLYLSVLRFSYDCVTCCLVYLNLSLFINDVITHYWLDYSIVGKPLKYIFGHFTYTKIAEDIRTSFDRKFH